IKCSCNYCLCIHIVAAMASATSLHGTRSRYGTGGRWSPRLWGLLVVVCGALFLDALDVSMVGVALPSIRADLGLSTASLQWVVSGYVLGYGGLLLLGGRAADLLGRRRVFLAALARRPGEPRRQTFRPAGRGGRDRGDAAARVRGRRRAAGRLGIAADADVLRRSRGTARRVRRDRAAQP